MNKKPHNNLVITIADENGLKQFRITKFAHKMIIYGGITFLLLAIGGYFAMNSIIYKLDSINQAKKHALIDYKKIYSENLSLRGDIDNKTYQLKLVNEKINDIESVMSMRNNDKIKANIKPVDINKISNLQKSTMLQIFPNGDPVAVFNSKNKTRHNKQSDRALNNATYKVGNATNTGYDYFTKEKEPVIASADGIVEFVRKNYRSGYGNIIRLTHALGFNSAYAHLSDITMKTGDFVSRGDVIGYTTPSNNKSTISLYYEVRFLSIGLDTLSFIKWSMNNFDTIFKSEDNSIIDFDNLIWAINDIVKLKELNINYSNENSN